MVRYSHDIHYSCYTYEHDIVKKKKKRARARGRDTSSNSDNLKEKEFKGQFI